MRWDGTPERHAKPGHKTVKHMLPFSIYEIDMSAPSVFLDMHHAAQNLVDRHSIVEPLIEVLRDEYETTFYVTGYREFTEKEKAHREEQKRKRREKAAEKKAAEEAAERAEYERLKEIYG